LIHKGQILQWFGENPFEIKLLWRTLTPSTLVRIQVPQPLPSIRIFLIIADGQTGQLGVFCSPFELGDGTLSQRLIAGADSSFASVDGGCI
jgi:hypothetical protein